MRTLIGTGGGLSDGVNSNIVGVTDPIRGFLSVSFWGYCTETPLRHMRKLQKLPARVVSYFEHRCIQYAA